MPLVQRTPTCCGAFTMSGLGLIGWRVSRCKPGLAVSGADSRVQMPLRVGARHAAPGKGLFLAGNPDYVVDYYAGHDVNVLLKYHFRPSDVTSGCLDDREPEISVSRATLLGWWVFGGDERPGPIGRGNRR